MIIMWKKIISLFLVICLLTTVVGCGGNGVTPPINDDNDDIDYSEISEEFIEEEKTFMVTAEEGGIFELSDRSRIEIPPNSLSKDATLYVAKINLESQDTGDFNSEIIYEVKIIERTVNILQPFKLFLPIPLGIDTSNIAVLRFDEDNNYEFINGTIGLKSIDNFIGIETEKSGTFTVTASDSDEDSTLYQDVAEIVDFFLEAKEYYTAGYNNWISSQYQQAKNEEQDALYRLEYTTPGLDWDKDGDEITMKIAVSTTLGMIGLIAGAFPELVVTKIIAIVSLVSAVGTTLYILKVYCKSIPAQYAIQSYYITQLKLKAISFFYEKIFLNISYIDASPPSGPAPHKVNIQGGISSDSGTKPYTFQWAFGDGNWSEKIQVNDGISSSVYHTYEEPGTYTPILYVEDANGREGQAEGGEITVTPPDDNDDDEDKELERIEVLPSSMTIKEGNSQSISSIKAYYSDNTTKSVSLNDPGLFYSNISPFIATVDDGKISGVKEGTVTIRVFYNDGRNVVDDVVVTVIPGKVLERIDVLPSSMTIKEGNSQSISSIKAYYLDDSIKSVSLSDSALTYENLNPSVATVSYGKITAKEAGTATIKVYYQDKGVATDKVVVTVLPPTTKVLERISVYPASMSLGQGESQYISSITAYYSNNTSANIFLSNPNLDYDSLNPGVADVYDNGKVTAIKPGSATIKVSYTDKVTVEDTVVVTVGGSIDPPESVDASIGASIWIYIWWIPIDGATHYKLYRATSETGTKTAISDWQTDTSFTDYDVNEGINYYYFVRAATSKTGANASTYSSYCIGFTIPPAPTGVSASQGTSMNSVYIIWNSASLATHYKLYRATSKTGTKTAISDWQTDTSFTDDDVIQGTTYYYFVKAAYYDSGSYYDSAYSSYAIGYPKPGDGTLPAPTGVDASDGTYTNKVEITWNSVSGASYYRVYQADSPGGAKTALGSWQSSTTYDDYEVTPGTHYFYFVKAATSNSGANASPYSDYDEGHAYLDPTLPAPTGVTASDGNWSQLVYIYWNSVSGASHYKVYRADSPTGTKTAVSSWQTNRSFYDHDVTQDVTYYYFVKAATSNSGANASPYSDYDEGFCTTILSAPTGVDASDGESRIWVRISWNSVSGASHYKVYRATSQNGAKTGVTPWQADTVAYDYGDFSTDPYYYFVKAATDSSGSNASPYSDYDIGWFKEKDLVVPTIYDPGYSVDSGVPYTVSWSDESTNGASKYNIMESTPTSGKVYEGNGTSKEFVHDVDEDTTYYYKVRAYYENEGWSEYSDKVDIVIKADST